MYTQQGYLQTAALWDLRNLKQSIHSLRAHQSEILQLAWSPHHDAVLATASSDRRILVWDLSRIDASQLPEEAEDGPPELLVSSTRVVLVHCLIHTCNSLCMVVIQTKSLISVGILQILGYYQAQLTITLFKYGRWRATFITLNPIITTKSTQHNQLRMRCWIPSPKTKMKANHPASQQILHLLHLDPP